MDSATKPPVTAITVEPASAAVPVIIETEWKGVSSPKALSVRNAATGEANRRTCETKVFPALEAVTTLLDTVDIAEPVGSAAVRLMVSAVFQAAS